MDQPKIATGKKWDWKTWVIVALGGAAAVAGAAFMMQSKHAALGRQVHRNVTRFLVDQGSQVNNGVISGGLVSTPMKTSTAVNSTIISMLNAYADMITQGTDSNPYTRRDPSDRAQASGSRRTQEGGSDNTPSPVTTDKVRRAPAAVILNPTDAARDDSGWASRDGRVKDVPVSEYNVDEFAPKGPKPSADTDLFAGDGIPSGAAPAAAAAGYE